MDAFDAHTTSMSVEPQSHMLNVKDMLLPAMTGVTFPAMACVLVVLVGLSLSMTEFTFSWFFCNCYDPRKFRGNASWMHRALRALQVGALCAALLDIARVASFAICTHDQPERCNDQNSVELGLGPVPTRMVALWVGVTSAIGLVWLSCGGITSLDHNIDSRLSHIHTVGGHGHVGSGPTTHLELHEMSDAGSSAEDDGDDEEVDEEAGAKRVSTETER